MSPLTTYIKFVLVDAMDILGAWAHSLVTVGVERMMILNTTGGVLILIAPTVGMCLVREDLKCHNIRGRIGTAKSETMDAM
jgi:hypothetical protein